jgi:hypothetical protein
MKYAAEMDSNATIYIPSFTEIGSSIQKFMGTFTDSMEIA